jgi:hypothetical protein
LCGFVGSDKSSVRLQYLLVEPFVLCLLFVKTLEEIIECVLELSSKRSI